MVSTKAGVAGYYPLSSSGPSGEQIVKTRLWYSIWGINTVGVSLEISTVRLRRYSPIRMLIVQQQGDVVTEIPFRGI